MRRFTQTRRWAATDLSCQMRRLLTPLMHNLTNSILRLVLIGSAMFRHSPSRRSIISGRVSVLSQSDKSPVIGFDSRAQGFFWLAGQGGYGVQTAPAAAQLASLLCLKKKLPANLAPLKQALVLRDFLTCPVIGRGAEGREVHRFSLPREDVDYREWLNQVCQQ